MKPTLAVSPQPYLLFSNLAACSEGFFGKNCSFSCKCKNGASCDPVTGSCRCPPGVSGDLCQDGELPPWIPAVCFFSFFPSMMLKPCFVSCVQVVLKASTGSSAIRNVTVPTTGAATGPTGPACVILDSTDASATSVSPPLIVATSLSVLPSWCQIIHLRVLTLLVPFFLSVS